ncbi:MAG: aspartate/glutamate racemase family protein [Lachnospiraceae bacterium]|nr:aspartate/glutamate racemase family protein [Lachnospiraceae bacterium]
MIVHGNTTTYGPKIGILMLDTHFPRIQGDIGNATTFNFPVSYRIVKEANADSVVLKQDPALIRPFIDAAKELQAEGCKCVITSCGFMAIFQKEIAAEVDIPVISSSLLQVRLVSSMMPGKKIGILTARASSLGEKHFAGVDIQDVNKVVYGIEDTDFGKMFFADSNDLDVDKARNDMVAVAKRMVEENPDIGAIVMECTNMPPFAQDIREATGLPVFDIIGLINYVHAAIESAPFSGRL